MRLSEGLWAAFGYVGSPEGSTGLRGPPTGLRGPSTTNGRYGNRIRSPSLKLGDSTYATTVTVDCKNLVTTVLQSEEIPGFGTPVLVVWGGKEGGDGETEDPQAMKLGDTGTG